MTWQRFIAVGDSFTEGLEDHSPTGYRGWADLLALRMAAHNPDLQYANLAIRGRKLPDIINRQLPLALDQEPDLVSIAGGVNDALRKSWNVSLTAERLEAGVKSARATGADVLVFTFGRLKNRSKALGLADNRIAEYRERTLEIAAKYDCYVMDFGPERVFDDPRFWAEDRLHLNDLGHERVSHSVAEVLGFGDERDWREALPEAESKRLVDNLAADAKWAAQHVAPWFGRRLQRKSSGDDVAAKRPILRPVIVRKKATSS